MQPDGRVMLSHQSVWRPVSIALSLSAALSIITLCDESVRRSPASTALLTFYTVCLQAHSS
jgi:hypothetical protein